MPASNQLVDGAAARAEVSSGNWLWNGSDPGTVTIPNDRIITWLDFKYYFQTTGTSQYGDNQCVDYSTLNSYRLAVAAPSTVSISDNSYCNYPGGPGEPGEPVYRVYASWAVGHGSYETRAEFSTDGGANYSVIATFAAGVTGGNLDTGASGLTTYVRMYHVSGTGGKISAYSNVASVFVNTLPCA